LYIYTDTNPNCLSSSFRSQLTKPQRTKQRAVSEDDIILHWSQVLAA